MTGALEGPVNGLSFDVEEHFHALNLRAVAPEESWENQERRVASSTRKILEQLSHHEVRATFFFLGWVAERDGDLVREVHGAGHEVASHGMSHRMAGELGRERFREEARRSKEILEEAIGAEVRGFRASTFSITKATEWALEILVEEGYRYDSSIFPVRHDRYGHPDFLRVPVRVETASGPIVELPMLTLRCLGMNIPAAGGGVPPAPAARADPGGSLEHEPGRPAGDPVPASVGVRPGAAATSRLGPPGFPPLSRAGPHRGPAGAPAPAVPLRVSGCRCRGRAWHRLRESRGRRLLGNAGR